MSKVIAIAGCVGRIGTTTQAIQMIKLIQENNMTACYLENNKSNYLKQMVDLYCGVEDKGSRLKYQGIDFYKRNMIKKIPKDKYDYLIRDYGSASADAFEENSFAEQPVKIIVCGSKPNEIFQAQELLMDPIHDDCYFVFSFVPKQEEISIYSMMGKRAEKTFFTGCIYDPFHLEPESNKIYPLIIKRSFMPKKGESYGNKI